MANNLIYPTSFYTEYINKQKPAHTPRGVGKLLLVRTTLMVLKWFLHSHLTGKREESPHTPHTLAHSLHTWQLNIPFTSAIYPMLAPHPASPLVSLTCVAWVKCPTERHRFWQFFGTTNPQKMAAIGLYGMMRNTVKLTGYTDSCPSAFLCPYHAHCPALCSTL